MSVPIPAPKRRGFVWTGLGAALAVLIALVAVVVFRPRPAPPPCCALPPDTTAIRGVPRQWQTAVAHGDTQSAWDLLTPEAQRRYGSPGGLRTALAALTPHPRGAATWRQIVQSSQGRGTPSEFFYVLIENRSLRPVGAVVVHSAAAGAPDGRVDPEVAATVRILEPVPRATVGTRPRMRVATDSPLAYAVVQASGQTLGSRGSIRDTAGLDAPFDEPVKPGPALIIAVDYDDKGHFTYGSVRVTVR
jgi:hypothetical protein